MRYDWVGRARARLAPFGDRARDVCGLCALFAGEFSAALGRIEVCGGALLTAVYGLGDSGAIAATMVTSAKETIREAGIFHIITIFGVQMTLVAAIFSWASGGSWL